ncbi:ComEA family DNA-binding protein [Nocardioides sp. MAH-18]|uniref:ComEA family DNA-binding protein n=1 Tax=Nocardioides agri TaxID=2682843 RepID=A0A6L6XM58_9ACTN|nr:MULTISPECIES: ComEA family DNA-binding protein [unclassified Nocardioides]MBA2956519.1 helix-hairpin-helix domain-containing protein [Nocardioides sp. CGMCC 1.13656]MVQ47666.1 ComEA family DNA-binding protein [Nocardioides sp. MAH-18]
MPPFRHRTGHQEAVSRRLAQLGAELAAQRPDPDEALDPGPEIPLPGRHASRRAAPGPQPWRDRWGLGPTHLVVVAVLAAVGLALTAWWVVRSQPSVVEAPPPTAPSGTTPALTGATPAASTPTASGAPTGSGTVTVDVSGAVRRPGIVVLDTGSRVVDAVEAAGGARRGANLSSVNLARLLVDGEQILVGAPAGAAGGAGPGPPAPSGPLGTVLVNINTASLAELETLPEVGPVTAQAIVTWREQHGGFSAIEELLEVDGIGDATLAQLTPHVTV